MTARAPGRKRSESSRQAILEASLTLLREHGYATLSTDTIAAAAGVGKQTIYRWWSSKADVVLEALTEHAREISAPDSGRLRDDVEVFFRATFRLVRGPRGTAVILKVLMAEAQLDAELASRFAAFIDTRRAALRSVLARHAKPGARVEAMVDMLFGAFWYRLLLGHAPLDPSFAKMLGELAARALAS